MSKARSRAATNTQTRLADIAREAGVSTATVSRVINNLSYVSDANRETVLAVVRRRDYYPNAHARSLASGRSHLIGLVISDIANPFFPELVKGMETAAFEHGYELLLANTNYDAQRMTSYVRRFIERGVRGVAIMTSEFDAVARRRARAPRRLGGVPGRGPAPARTSAISPWTTWPASTKPSRTSPRSATRRSPTSAVRRACSRPSGACRRSRSSLQRHVRSKPAWIGEGDFRLEGGRLAARQMLGASRASDGGGRRQRHDGARRHAGMPRRGPRASRATSRSSASTTSRWPRSPIRR